MDNRCFILFLATPKIVEFSSSTKMTEGETVTLSCNVSSEPKTYVESKWYKGGLVVSEDPPKTIIRYDINNGYYELMIKDLLITDSGNYTCYFNNTLIPDDVNTTICLTVIRCKCCFRIYNHVSFVSTSSFEVIVF